MELLHIKFCILEYSREATIYKLKLFKNRFRKDNSLSKKKIVGYINYYLH